MLGVEDLFANRCNRYALGDKAFESFFQAGK